MPVPTETLWNTKRLNAAFAVISTLTLGSIGWMLWHDYDRPWRHTQRTFFNVRSAMALFDVLWYEAPEQIETRGQLAAAVESAEKDLSTPDKQKELRDLQNKERRLVGEHQGVSLSFGNLNAELQVKLFNVEDARVLHGPNDPKTRALQEDYDQSQIRLAAIKLDRDKLEDSMRSVRVQLREINRRKTEAQKALGTFDKGRQDAERFESMYGPGLTRAIFNMPGLDFAAPKGTPGLESIQQVFSRDIRFNYNFLDSYVTDRCMTCHIGIDNPAFSVESFVAKTEAAMKGQRVMDVVRAGNGRLATELPKRLGAVEVSDLPAEDLGAIQDDAPEQQAKKRKTRENLVRRLVYAANEYLKELARPAIEFPAILNSIPADKAMTRGAVQDEIDKVFRSILAATPPRSRDGRALSFAEMNEAQKMSYVASLAGAMNLFLVSEGRPKIDFKEEIRAHPHLDLYLSPKSAHPMKTMGCTVCHEGSGQETDFVFAAHTPKNHAEEKRWEEEYYVRELGIPLATFHLVEEFWERPMMLPGYTSASCRKCHSETFDLERHRTLPMPSAQRIVEGRDKFTSLGCINCHNVEGLTDSRRVGTDLTHVASKLAGPFMQRWIEYPNNFRPSTLMPHFFKQENNLPSSANEFDPNPILRTETEIAAITKYLQTFSKPLPESANHPLPDGLTGDAKRGEELFVSVGCLACHANLDAKDPLDSAGRSFGEKWLTDEFVHQGASEEDAKKRLEGMSKNDRVRYAMRTFTPERREIALSATSQEEATAMREDRDPDPARMYVPPAFTRDAPELSGIGTKLINDPSDTAQAERSRRWLYNWLREPRHYSSYTKMPRLFRDDYYWEDDTATRRRKNDQDILDVAAFLLSLRNDDFKMTPIVADDEHRAEMQRLILMLLGGQNTEAVSKKILMDEKATPSDPHGRLTSAIVVQAYHSFGGGEQGRSRVADILEKSAPSLVERQQLYLGIKMISHYGCYACHTIPGFEEATRPGTDVTLWAEKFMSQLDFAFFSPIYEHELESQPDVFGHMYPVSAECEILVRDSGANPEQEVLYNHGSFAYHKFMNPRIWDRKKIKKPYEKLKMPNYFLTEEEGRSLVTWMLSMKQPNVYPAVRIDYERTPAGKVARGRALVRELNCIGCHVIEGNQANIQQYYSSDTSMSDTDPRGGRFMPPLLWGEGAKVQPDWLFTFLSNVEMLRPWMKARMPSFHLTTGQATTLVEYFAGAAQNESQVLRKEIDPVVRYLQHVHGGTGAEGAKPEAWFLDPALQEQAAFLAEYGVAKKQIRLSDLNTKETAPEAVTAEIGGAYQKSLERETFLSGLFNVAFPFSDPTRHFADDERFNRGEEFFYNQKCLACHVAGDPKKPGTTTDIKAPNFALTNKRLRYDWVLKWLQDPQAIQPGANMPQIFTGGSAFSTMAQPQRDEFEAKFGKTADEQASLLVDFLYTMGEKGYTAIQPGATDAPPAQPPAGDQPAAEFDFEADAAGKPAASQPAEKKDDLDF